ncbi:MAG: DUF4838 domain-containing protein [Clostridia bacterium]|nr:DUF4838 domain-containing protein [Clostridia bacterium]
MYRIFKITSSTVVDFAAEELKKYLRMMMPRCGEIDIVYDPEAKEGFRLGLMDDFGLDTSEEKDRDLDDIIHIDTDENGGIIAGNNHRSVLLAVYRYLTENGCRWLFPGVEGELIPVKEIEPVVYHKMADQRYRGQCNEGAESQQCMMETIVFSPKVGMIVYMLEFDIPQVYYDYFYNHRYNEKNREPEPVSSETVLQWKRACEVEIAKRGLQFHDMGHGWSVESFGISTASGWDKDNSTYIPEESRQYLAEIDGERGLFHGVAMNTNFCMSNKDARKIFVKTVCDYAQINTHVAYLHVWLADWQRNHCECENCRKKIPSDWYVILLNEIDEELTKRNLPTRIVFCAYSDTAYQPLEEKIKNPKRFTIQLGAISRSYTYSVEKDPKVESLAPYILNQSSRLDTMEEYIVRLNEWKKFAPCNSLTYEYHFWKHQFYAPGVLSFAKRVCEDIISYRENGFDGIIEDGSQRCFFPNGFSFYCYGKKLFDNALTYEELENEYFTATYGEAKDLVLDFLKCVDEHMPQSYMECKHSARIKSNFYKPEMEEKLLALVPKVQEYREKLSAYKNMPKRVQTVAVRLMILYTDYVEGLAKVMAIKCVGKDDEAKAAAKEFLNEFGKNEIAWERYYDHKQMYQSISAIFDTKKPVEM